MTSHDADLKDILSEMTPLDWEEADYDIRKYLAKFELCAYPYKDEQGYIQYRVRFVGWKENTA